MPFRVFSSPAIGASFAETAGGGAIEDINAPRNAPAKTPASHLALIDLHSELDYMEASHGPVNVTINHPAVSAGDLPPDATIAFGWAAASYDYLLLAHGLGYPPIAMAVYQNNLIWPGMPVQLQGDGGARYVGLHVNNTEVRLSEYASIGSSPLSAASRTYTIYVFRRPPAPSGAALFEFDQATGVLKLARNKVRSDRRYLQVAPGGSPFGIALGRTIDLRNGAPRAARPDGTIFDPVPAGLNLGLSRGSWPRVYGSSMAYNGSFAGSPSFQVQVP